MARVFLDLPDKPSLLLPAPVGAALADLCDDVLAPVRFSCRGASCGTCLVEVIEGGAELEPPSEEEAKTLAHLGHDPQRWRLACVAKLRPGDGLVRVRPVRR